MSRHSNSLRDGGSFGSSCWSGMRASPSLGLEPDEAERRRLEVSARGDRGSTPQQGSCQRP